MKPLAFQYRETHPGVLQKGGGGDCLPDILRLETPRRGDYRYRCNWMLETVDGDLITGLRNFLANVFCGDVKGKGRKKSLLVAFYHKDPLTHRSSFTMHLFEGYCPRGKGQRQFVEDWAKRHWQEKYLAREGV